MAAAIYHLRSKPPRRGGNSFYRDKSVHESTTLCGAPCGLMDQPHDSHLASWTRDEDGRRFEVCAACVAAREVR